MFKKLLNPHLKLKDIFDVNETLLHRYNVKTLIFDVDNTLIAKDETILSDDIIKHIESLKNVVEKVILVTNNSGLKRLYIAQTLDVQVLTFALKPFSFRFKQFMGKVNLKKPMMMVGDQVFTDVLFAKRIKAIAVLVNPISQKEYISTRMLRIIESKWVDRA